MFDRTLIIADGRGLKSSKGRGFDDLCAFLQHCGGHLTGQLLESQFIGQGMMYEEMVRVQAWGVLTQQLSGQDLEQKLEQVCGQYNGAGGGLGTSGRGSLQQRTGQSWAQNAVQISGQVEYIF